MTTTTDEEVGEGVIAVRIMEALVGRVAAAEACAAGVTATARRSHIPEEAAAIGPATVDMTTAGTAAVDMMTAGTKIAGATTTAGTTTAGKMTAGVMTADMTILGATGTAAVRWMPASVEGTMLHRQGERVVTGALVVVPMVLPTGSAHRRIYRHEP